MRYFSAFLLLILAVPAAAQNDPQTQYYQKVLRPVMVTHCFKCHNGGDKKAGLNLEDVYFAISIVNNGPTWVNVIDQIRSGNMPPSEKPRIPEDDKELLISGIESLLDSALSVPDPGQVVMRRLSNREYRYTVLDILGVDFDARSFFPADASGGEGFDNQARVLYITPLQMERYLLAADSIVARLAETPDLWHRVVASEYPSGWLDRIGAAWASLSKDPDAGLENARETAALSLFPLATRMYRRLLRPEDKEQLLEVFADVYRHTKGDPERFNRSLQETVRFMLVSPHFLYRREADLPATKPYQISGFEMASRLSYFLWSSTPDSALLEAAYRQDLHDPVVLRSQLNRMLADPKSMRLAESFAGQWLEVDELVDGHNVDAGSFPEFTPDLGAAMQKEAALFFHHVLTESRNFLDLIDSDYSFLNPSLAAYYGVETKNTDTDVFERIVWPDDRRGGVLGLGGVLTVTSLPTRTSPVLRGKWVLEQLLGTPPPPPPPDVPELEESGGEAIEATDLRTLLGRHRAPGACYGCHQKMDPLGFALENFDGAGRWRESYGSEPIDASGVLPLGETFEGPAELRQVLLVKKELFARNLSRKMLSFALGRGIRFQDKRTVDALADALLENDFETTTFLFEVVNSFPFRYKKSDLPYYESTP